MGVVMHGCVGEWVDVSGVVGGEEVVWLVRGGGVVWLCVVVWCEDVCGCVVCGGRGCGWEWAWVWVDGGRRGLRRPGGCTCACVDVCVSWRGVVHVCVCVVGGGWG